MASERGGVRIIEDARAQNYKRQMHQEKEEEFVLSQGATAASRLTKRAAAFSFSSGGGTGQPCGENRRRRTNEGGRVWNTVTDNFGNAPSLEWNSSHSRDLQISSLDLQDKPVPDEDDNAAPCDEEELSEQLNMHSIIVSCISDEPILTAEQVIEEIEEMMMMHESPEGEGETSNKSDHMSLLSQELGALKRSSIAKACDDGLRCLSSGELCELLEEMEGAVQHFSQELVQQLALRDELEFEKEVKNSFISALIEVQTKQKELREIQRKKKRRSMGPGDNKSDKPSRMPVSRFSMEGLSNVIQNGLRQTFGGSVGEKQYLTTVIPYEKKGSPPSVEDLQAITKILFAMKDDSEKVPTLLTDYILKVLCPT
uniref:Fasciculation and elongation protein zeta 1 (zygin I) n=1 Tax=Eptatretus burgeri TaxID=7764 RepID=A0A8C4R5I9_EPTBU